MPCWTATLPSPVQRPEAGRRSPGREAAQVKFRLVVSQAEASFLLEREEAAPVCRLQALRNDAKREGCHIRLHDNKDSGPSEQPSCCRPAAAPLLSLAVGGQTDQEFSTQIMSAKENHPRNTSRGS